MTTPSISVEHLAKQFRLTAGFERGYRTIRDAIGGVFRRREPGDDDPRLVWALRDVTFDVQPGEAIGLIGHNGAGKSTLLKILSRITEPTRGQAILRGRVASLLEVGTGFHPELTGRENVFLNGAILGMSRAEIRQNFDAIVEFSGVERFLDTPVKRYSSGMYLRLAFAVAAHLTPEILLVDEVLAVGDADFQRRCLGRMNEVARSGRTIIFVSHNLASIEQLCHRTVLLARGGVRRIGPSQQVIAEYLGGQERTAVLTVNEHTNRNGEGRARIRAVEIRTADGRRTLDVLEFRKPFVVRIHFEVHDALAGASFGFGLLSARGERVFITESFELGQTYDLATGSGWIDCTIAAPNVVPGVYRLELWISDLPGVRATDHLPSFGEIEVIVPTETGEQSVSALTSGVRGYVVIDASWTTPVAAILDERP